MQPQTKVVEHPQKNDAQGFDLRTHIKDAKTGRLLRVQPYTLHIIRGDKYFERPPKSGNLFYESGEAAGVMIGGDVKLGQAHSAYVEPITNERTFPGVVSENEALRAELAALKAEKEKEVPAEAAKRTEAQKPAAKQG
jgi:hypothetical protein